MQRKTVTRPNWLRKAKSGIQYLFSWTDDGSIYVTKYHKDDRKIYSIDNDICDCPGFTIAKECCHMKALKNEPDGNPPTNTQKLEIISYVMNTYASMSNKVDISYKKLEGKSVIKFTMLVTDMPKCKLVFWWNESPVIIDFIPMEILSGI